MECPACGGDLELLGYLGNLMHCRCRNCGMDCSRQKPPVDIEEDEDDGPPLGG